MTAIVNPTGRVFIVSYRLPQCRFEGSVVGLQNGSVMAAGEELRKEGKTVFWVGFTGQFPGTNEEKDKVTQELSEQHQIPVFVDQDVAKGHFNEFCKSVVWPLFHYYGNKGQNDFDTLCWESYQKVNKEFAETIAKHYQEGDLLFIQDYHLMLLPQMLREKFPNAAIIHYTHIPWPTSELYRSLPVRTEVLLGLLGADLLGFQTFSYAKHFMSACTRLLGVTVTDKGVVNPQDRFVGVEVFPTGIDPTSALNALETEAAKKKCEELKKSFEGIKLIVSRDRIEYVKGIPYKLRSFAAFLTHYPEWQGKVVLFQECRPNTEVINEKNYRDMQDEIEQLVGSINGKFGTIGYTPIHYLNKHLPWEDSCALFSMADAALVTPLRDGMNLTSHEFVCCQKEKMSPLILSEFVGSAQCLSGAVLVNPWDEKKVSKAIHTALIMPENAKRIRFKHNFDYVMNHDAKYWIKSVFAEIEQMKLHLPTQDIPIKRIDTNSIVESYKKSKKRIFLFDYDGTLSPLVKTPDQAVPSTELVDLLRVISSKENNYVYVISGRDRGSLETWLGELEVGMSCEHGLFFRQAVKGGQKADWVDISSTLDLSWKTDIKSIFDDYADRTPGALVESKEINITWHYRNADPVFGEYQKKDLLLHLHNLPSIAIDILPGKKAVEIRPQGVNKGSGVRRILSTEPDVDFVLCLGDDKTDEDMFEELRKHEEIPACYTVTVEKKSSLANYYLEDQGAVITLLKDIAAAQ